MFRAERSNSTLGSGFAVLELIYHSTVRYVRRSQTNAIIGLLRNILQTVLLIVSFYVMMNLLGMRTLAIRGDFVLYLMSGIFLYMTHTRTITAVFGAESSTSAMMKHAPLTTAITISASALGTLYLQILSMIVVLYIYHAAFNPIEINYWPGALGMLLLSWFTGVGIGIIFLAMKPWSPGVVTMIQLVYTRANMIASGKMFTANNMTHQRLELFSWNPLFHTIDQCRGFTFENYFPHYTNWVYPIYVGLALLAVGLMAEFYTRQHASVSWNARR